MKKFVALILLSVVLGHSAELPPHRGESATLKFPEGFKIEEKREGKFDASSGDVLIARATNEEKHEIRIFHASHVPVSNDEIARFVEATVSFYSRLPEVEVTGSEVSEIRGRNWGKVMMKRRDRRLVMLFYSMDGSPTRIEIHGSAGDEVHLEKLAKAMMGGADDEKG